MANRRALLRAAQIFASNGARRQANREALRGVSLSASRDKSPQTLSTRDSHSGPLKLAPRGDLPAGNAAAREILRLAMQQSQARTFNSAAAAASKVIAVASDSEFSSALKHSQESNQLAVVDFTAVWCAPCRTIAPLFEQLSEELDDVTFLKVDIDEESLQETVVNAGIRAVPTFQFHKGGSKVAEFSGADQAKLKELISVLRQA